MMDIDYIAKKIARDDLNSTHLYETDLYREALLDDFYFLSSVEVQNTTKVESSS